MEVSCHQSNGSSANEIIIAYLSSIGFSMFEETETGVNAYIVSDEFNNDQLEELFGSEHFMAMNINYSIKKIPYKNWNESWESNFQPVRIGKKVFVRAEYHQPDPEAELELVIQPRMAFGTGHHATTALMIEAMLEIDLKNKSVLDMGCGTGILAILAAKKGARMVTAIDIDSNATENTELNKITNHTPGIKVLTGGAAAAGSETYDVILANINRNIILNDLPLYLRNLKPEGLLITSGYYEKDLDVIQNLAEKNQLNLLAKKFNNDWCCATFQ